MLSLFSVSADSLINGTSPIMYQCIRCIFSLPIMIPMALIIDRKRFYRGWTVRDALQVVVLGLTGVAGNGILYSWGLKLSSAVIAGVMQPCLPVLTFLLSLALRRESMNRWKALGLLSAVVGALIVLRFERIFMGDTGVSQDGTTLWGVLLLMVSFCCYSTYLIIQKPLLERYPPMSMLTWAIFVGKNVTMEEEEEEEEIVSSTLSSRSTNHHQVAFLVTWRGRFSISMASIEFNCFLATFGALCSMALCCRWQLLMRSVSTP
jgi:drug/metabolite transporter (DMT)-like permease